MQKNDIAAKNVEFDERLKRIERNTKGKRGRLGKVTIRALLIVVAMHVAMVLAPPFHYPVQGVVTSVFFFRQKPDVRGRLPSKCTRGWTSQPP
jgi:hypothetical protein